MSDVHLNLLAKLEELNTSTHTVLHQFPSLSGTCFALSSEL